MREQGKIIIKEVKNGFEYKIVYTGKKGTPVPLVTHDYEFDLSLNEKPCEFEKDSKTNKFLHIWVDGVEIPKKADRKNSYNKKTQKESPEKTFDNVKGLSTQKNTVSKVNNLMADSFDLSKTKIPANVRNSNIGSIDNFYLKLNRAARVEKADKNSEKFLFWREEKKIKNIYIESFQIKPDFEKIDLNRITIAYKESISDLFPTSHIIEMTFEPEWRMIVGLGNESIYEVSMTLHHIYGFPYIPASAIKGMTRNWLIVNRFGKNEKDEIDLKKAEMRALQDKEFCDLFGCPEKESFMDENGKTDRNKSFYEEARKGNIIFFDAFPSKPPIIEVDIINPHFGDYYAGKKPPADYLSPTPIPFLTVTDTPFKFYIALSRKLTKNAFNEEKSEQEILSNVAEYLKNALTENGIGAKTAVGYGLMRTS